jgi:hypothetical protein
MHAFKLDHVLSYKVQVRDPLEVIGRAPSGVRVNIYTEGGIVTGPDINGRVLPVGGDWFTLRDDGIGVLDVRSTIETDDGALIYVNYTGLTDWGVDGYQKYLEGRVPEKSYLRVVPRLEASHPSYKWLNRLQFVGVGEFDGLKFEASYDFYAIV